MTSGQVFTSRLRGRPLLDDEEISIGRVRDVVILPTAPGTGLAPRALGLVVTLQRRRIFVSFGRISELSTDGAHLRGGAVDLGRFTGRPGEILASDLYGKVVDGGTVSDVSIAPAEGRRDGWDVCSLAIRARGLRFRSTQIVPWDKYPELFKAGALAEQLAGLRELNPTDLASAVDGMTPDRRTQIAAALEDNELADVLEEMPEQDQIRLLASLNPERIADVVEEMEPDDAVDLLAEMPDEERDRLLASMEPAQAADLRRLLRYGSRTAGGLMTSQPLVVAPDVPVAEMLARVRDASTRATTAAQVFVCAPPTMTPTGRFLGTIGFQRLLRRPPSMLAGDCVQESTFVRPELSERELAARLAAYNLISVAVCDEAGRLLGAVTVDDVLDHLLPADWRRSGG
jgi:CBS domain-containing protein